MDTLVTLCIVTSEVTETVDAAIKTYILILAETRRGELTTQMAVTGTGRETSWICKQCTNDLWTYLGLQNLFFKKVTFFLVGMWILVFDSGGNDLLIFLRLNDVDLDVFRCVAQWNKIE